MEVKDWGVDVNELKENTLSQNFYGGLKIRRKRSDKLMEKILKFCVEIN